MLPIDDVMPELRRALRSASGAVLAAPPGAGKTTRVPIALLNEPWVGDGKIILLSPRRVAARAAAAHMAAQLGEPVGRTIGFRVRLESRVSRATRVEIVTEGVFTRQILANPALEGVACVIFDEFHERSLDGDLGLALALEAQGAFRKDLKVLVMSATLDAGPIATALGGVPVIVSEGRLQAVATRYLGHDVRTRIEPQIAGAARKALREESGSILCFLPGAGEIERTARLLEESVRDGRVDIHPLYGAMDGRAQDAAIAPSAPGRRKIVLATSLAETSLTIEGVRVVIDSGLARRPRFEPATGITRLQTVRVSQAAAEQRRGRAGRTEPGVCWRLWDEGETRALAPFDAPEILEADLSGLALDLAQWGAPDPYAMTWLDPPPAPAWARAQKELAEIGAIDGGRLSEYGQKVAALPLPPRLAHVVVAVSAQGQARLAARMTLALTEQGLGGRGIDLGERIARFTRERTPRAIAALRLADRVAQAAGAGDGAADEGDVGPILAFAFPDRVAKSRTPGCGEYLMASGRAAVLDSADPLARSPYLAIADFSGSAERAAILAAAPLSLREIETLFDDRIEIRETVGFDAAAGAVRGRRARMFGKIALSEGPLEALAPVQVQMALLDAIRADLNILPWRETDRQLRARVALMRAREDEGWPDLGDDALRTAVDEWLAPALAGVSRLDQLADGPLSGALAALLPYPLRTRLDRDAPARLSTPGGGSVLIDYTADGGPAAQVRLQEMFGLGAHPIVAGEPLTLVLLSPAQRPIQTTKDLPRFWRGSYADVRAEMRGRYPKHPWPDDPLNAPPTRRAKARPP